MQHTSDNPAPATASPAAPAEDTAIVLGGRRFRPIGNSTVEHDLWTMGQLHRAGLGQGARPAPDEDAEAYAHRLAGELAASGRAALLIGGVLLPEGTSSTAWTPAIAEATAEHVRGLTDEADRQLVFALLLQLLASIFEAQLAHATAASELVRRMSSAGTLPA